MSISTFNIPRFEEVVKTAASQLVTTELIAGGCYITTPLLYPDGSYVVVRVENNGDEYFVSDFGSGLEEAEMMGGGHLYSRVGNSIAERCGVGFDRHSFFALVVREEQLPGAVAVIANCSLEAVSVVAMKVAERKSVDENQALFDRLETVFTSKYVAKDASVIGASNTEWHISNLVTIEGHSVAFEAVSKHPTSIVHAAAKFGDIARMKDAPGRVAVVTSKKQLNTYLGVLNHSADVIEKTASDSVFQGFFSTAA